MASKRESVFCDEQLNHNFFSFFRLFVQDVVNTTVRSPRCGTAYDVHSENTGSRADNHSKTSANQSTVMNIPHEKPEDCPTCFPLKIKHSNGAKAWRIENRPFKISNNARLLMKIGISATIEWGKLHSIQCWIRMKSLCVPPLSTLLHCGQIENLWGKGRSLELNAEPSMPSAHNCLCRKVPCGLLMLCSTRLSWKTAVNYNIL